MYQKICVVLILIFSAFVCIVNAQNDRFAGYDAEFWKDVDERLQEIDLTNGICVLPFEAEEKRIETEPYRSFIESRLIKLNDRTYKVVCRNFDDIKEILDNWELETSDLFKQSTISRIGKFLGVQVVATGSIFRYKYSTGAYGYLQFIDVESGRILFAEQVYFTNPIRLVFSSLLLDQFPAFIQADQYYFWQRLDSAVSGEEVQRICVLPVPEIEEGVFYRHQLEMGLTKLEDYKYQVLTRDKEDIESLMEVEEFDMSDLVDPNSAARIGKMIGASAVVLFERSLGDSVKFQVIHTESARILFKGTGEKDNSRNRAVWSED